MYRILMPVDADEDRARAQAAFVSSLPGAADAVSVTLLFVFGGEGEDLPDELARYKSADRVGSVRRARDRLEAEGVDVDVTDASGDPADVILEEAAELGADLVVMGGRKRSPVGKALFGSVAQTAILEGDRPVTVTGAAEE